MKIYKCPRCGHTVNQKNDLRKHFQRKISCQVTLHDISITECFQTVLNEENNFVSPNVSHSCEFVSQNVSRVSLNVSLKNQQCTFCDKEFNHRQSKFRHEKKCKNKDKKQFGKIEEENKIIENLKTENEILKNSKNTTIQNNMINNNNNTVIINAFGKENLAYISKEYIHGLIKEGPLKIASAIFNVTHLKNYKFFR